MKSKPIAYPPLKPHSSPWYRFKAGRAWVAGRDSLARAFERKATEAEVLERVGLADVKRVRPHYTRVKA